MNDLIACWDWLPAFRAVAETEHLPSASERLHVSPSALSRQVRLLESSLGVELFERHGRKLTLNPSGAQLLSALRDGMGRITTGLPSDTPRLSGPVHLSATGVITPAYVIPAVARLHDAHPELVACLHTLETREANRRLLAGEIEAAFYNDAVSVDGLVIEQLGHATTGVYCGRTHPVVDDTSECEFVAPFTGAQGVPMDGWPVEKPRRIATYTDSLRVRLTICLEGRLLAVLPDAIARPYLEEGALRRLRLEFIPASEMFAARRAGSGGVADLLVDAVRSVIVTGS